MFRKLIKGKEKKRVICGWVCAGWTKLDQVEIEWGTTPWDTVVRIGGQVVRGVQAVHIHSDMEKSRNRIVIELVEVK